MREDTGTPKALARAAPVRGVSLSPNEDLVLLYGRTLISLHRGAEAPVGLGLPAQVRVRRQPVSRLPQQDPEPPKGHDGLWRPDLEPEEA